MTVSNLGRSPVSLVNVASRLRGTGKRNRGSNFGRKHSFFSTASGPSVGNIQQLKGHWSLFLQAYSSQEVKNLRISTNTPKYASTAGCLIKHRDYCVLYKRRTNMFICIP
jgi:hypothetical protein